MDAIKCESLSRPIVWEYLLTALFSKALLAAIIVCVALMIPCPCTRSVLTGRVLAQQYSHRKGSGQGRAQHGQRVPRVRALLRRWSCM